MRVFLADTAALLVFFTATGILNERFVAGMGWDEVLAARLIGAPLMVLTARPYGLWRDRVMDSRAAPPAVLDTVALLGFQVPLYTAIIAAGGAREGELLRGAAGATVLMLVAGRPYGLWLDAVRRAFGIPARR